MKEDLKKKLHDLRDRVLHRFAVLAIRGIARGYNVKLPDVKPGAWLILRTRQYTVMFQPSKLPPRNQHQVIGWEWLQKNPEVN